MANPVNWLFLAELIVVVIVVSAFLFYWNRILGSFLAFVIRLFTWRKYNAYVIIGSFQISPLAGRIAFRDVEYHSSNLSCRILHGHITFRYWKVRVRQQGDSASPNTRRARLPCRITAKLEGVELFCYNRTPAYDDIVERMKKHEAAGAQCKGDGVEEGASSTAHTTRTGPRLRKPKNPLSRETTQTTGPSPNDSPIKEEPESLKCESRTPVTVGEISWIFDSLPLELHIVTGSVVLGSDATPMVLIVDFKAADGVVDLSEPRSSCDLYRMSTTLALSDVNVLMRTNVDYSGPLLSHGKRVYEELLSRDPALAAESPSSMATLPGFRWLAKKFKFLYDPRFSVPPVSGIPTDRIWKGLARYRLPDEQTDPLSTQHDDWEYAKVATILSTRSLDLTYYTDTPGLVPATPDPNNVDVNNTTGNVEPAPEWGVDIGLHGGNVNYGPWADRQRLLLQKAFVPSVFFDNEPHKKLKPGDLRVHDALVINITITERTTLRIPTREASKDWMWDNVKRDAERRYGWLDVVVGPNSSVAYTQSQIPSERGYDSMLNLHLDSLDIASSVNLQSFVAAKACKLSMSMPTPFLWNAQRNWGIDLTLDTPDILLLREHVTLIADLSKDWSGGATGDFHHFVPVHYNFRLSLVRYAIHLFINDFNIVDVPRSRDHNAFLDIKGPRLDSFVAVSSTRYRPEFSVVPFTVDANDVQVELSVPSWDTHRVFGAPSIEVGKITTIKVSGSYRYYSRPSPDHQEELKLNLQAEKVGFYALGWVVRRIFCVKENYFGNFTQFSTMQEYLEKFDHSPDSVGDPIVQKYRPGRSDPFAVHLTVDVRDSLVLMSDEIYGCEKGIAIPVPQLLIDLKNNEFQMDMSLDIAPTYVVACDNLNDSYENLKAPLARSQDVVFVEGVDIKANRLFGPQPRATTYVCIWEINVSRVSAFLSPQFKSTLAAVGTAVGYNWTDHDNAPASVYIAKTPPDATFVKLSIGHVTALLSSGDYAGIAIELPQGVFLDTSSMASKACRSVMGLGIPTATAHVVHRRKKNKRWEPVGSVSTGLSLDNYKLPKGWQEEAAAQQLFLKEQDAPTRRIPYLYDGHDDHAPGRHHYDSYVPCPRPAQSGVDAGSSTATTETMFEDSSESEQFTDDTHPSVSVSRFPRRRRTLSNARALERLSILDAEDDTSSSGTSSSGTSDTSPPSAGGDEDDVSAILEARLWTFKKIYQRAQRLFDATSAAEPSVGANSPGKEDVFIPLTIPDGSIFRINLERTAIELNPGTLKATAQVSAGMSDARSRPEVLLDSLLAEQVSAVLKRNTAVEDPTLFDINVPLVELRIVLGHFNNPDSLVQCSLENPSVRFLESPIPESQTKALTATVGVRGAKATLSRKGETHNVVSLRDVPNFTSPPLPDSLLPFLQISASNLGVTFNRKLRDTTIQLKAADSGLETATQTIPILSELLDRWRPVIKNLPSPRAGLPAAELMYGILRDATAEDITSSLPNFMYESPYALQFNDQRDLRHDMGWFTLARLRHWLRTMGRPRPWTNERPTPEAMAKDIVDTMVRMDEPMVNEDIVVGQPFLHKAFGSHLDDAGLTPESRMDSSVGTFVNIASLAIRHYGRLLETDAIAASAVTVEGVTVAHERVKLWEERLPIVNVRAVLAVHRLVLDLRNSFLTAYDAVLDHVDEHDEPHVEEVKQDFHDLPAVKALDCASAIVVDVHLGELSAGVSAGGMRLDITVTDAQGSGTMERTQQAEGQEHRRLFEHNSVLINCSSVQSTLREATDSVLDSEVPVDRSLVVAAIRGVRCAADSTLDNFDPKGGAARLLLGIEAFEFDSRPQLKAFFDFGRDWRQTHYPLYVPTIEHTKAVTGKRRAIQEAKGSASVERRPIRRSVFRAMAIDLYLGSVHVQARAAKGLWLGWDMGHVYASRQGPPDHFEFGLRVDPQVVGAYNSAKRVKTKDSSIIRLPSITATGTYRDLHNRPHLTADVNLGMFTGIIKPTVLDRLLSLHQRLGNDVLAVIRETRGPKAPQESPVSEVTELSTETVKHPLAFRVQASVAGFRVGLRADNVPTTLVFEALELKGSASNIEHTSLQWTAQANHVGVSIMRMPEGTSYQTPGPLHGARSVSMVFDIKAEEIPGSNRSPSELNIAFTRVHTVMHVAALSELGDLIRSWSSDIVVLREVHAEEVAEVKEQTTRVLKKLEASSKEIKEHAKGKETSSISTSSASDGTAGIESWFASRILTVEVTGIGIAIPLDEGAPIDVAKKAGGAGPALLYSVRLMSLKTSRTETARFSVQQTLLQFVDQFDPGKAEHFQGSYHVSTNFMMLPNIDAEAQMTSTPEKVNITAHCSATDFKLSLTPDIADGIARLGDLYEHGKEHLAGLENNYLNDWAKGDQDDSVAAKYDIDPDPAARQRQAVVARVSFRFDSGVVELHRHKKSREPRPALSAPRPRGRKSTDQHDRFTLPTVSVWMEYTGPTTQDDENRRTLLLNLAVHESRNVLHPTILPFFVEIITRCEQHAKSRRALRTQTPPESPKSTTGEPSAPITERALERIAEARTGKLHLRITLRIDRSELRLSCAPDSNAYVDLKWESGGFAASTLLGGTDTTTFGGSVSGVTAYLSHEFAETGRGCIEAGAKDLAFSVSLCTQDPLHRGLSILVDTEVSVKFRLEAFSAWLIFKSVWVDNAPKMELKRAADAPTIPERPALVSRLGVAVLVRLRSIDFDANVSVSQARLTMTPIVIRTVANGEQTEIELDLGKTQITANGDISGDLCSESLRFSTVRRSSRASVASHPHVLEMNIHGGDLRGNLFIGDMNIVRFQLEPSTVTLADDWADHAKDPAAPVKLDFIVNAGQFAGVLRLPAIPRLLGHFYTMFDLADSQTRIAAQRSPTFAARQKRAAGDTTPMTTVVLSSKKSSSQTGSTATSMDTVGGPSVDASADAAGMTTVGHVKTAQRMRFDLKGIDVGIYADNYDDGTVAEFYRFYIGNVSADLFRMESPAGHPMRDLELHVSFVEWQTSSGKIAARAERHDISARELIDAAGANGHRDVVVLPLMNLKMGSTEYKDPRCLEYDFDVKWGPTDGDIKILPNFFEAAFKSFRKLLNGIDEQQLARAKRRGVIRTKSAARMRADAAANGGAKQEEDKLPELVFRRRGEGPFNNPVPKLRALGESTGEAAMMIPRIKRAMGELPAYSHRFVTLQLEDAMDLLLKLYEKQLPDLTAEA